MKILIISDAGPPQINGVVTSYAATAKILRQRGHEVLLVTPVPGGRWTFGMPGYPEILLEFFATRRLSALLDGFQPDLVHLATEGPLGWTARGLLLKRGMKFSTAFHTLFPDYVARRTPWGLRRLSARVTYAVLRRFHAPSCAVMAPTPSVQRLLRARGFQRLTLWSRGVEDRHFRPGGPPPDAYAGLPRPILLYVGRVAAEKNLPAFLALKTPGSKVVIGDGPLLPTLRARYPATHFLGKIVNEALQTYYAAADLFVFPSITDTFGLVLLEACAAGLRVAAHPAPGPADIFSGDEAQNFTALDDDLQLAVERALALPNDHDTPRAFAARFSWEACTDAFWRSAQGEIGE